MNKMFFLLLILLVSCSQTTKKDDYIYSPVFSIQGGEFDKDQTINIQNLNKSGDIYYSINQNSVDNTSEKFINPFVLSEGTHNVKAIVYKNNKYSNITEENYIIKHTQVVTSLKVHFKKPAHWANTVKIHYWNTKPEKDESTWPGKDMINEGGDWFYYQFSNNITSANMVINDATTLQTTDLTRDKEGWYYTDNTWYDQNPDKGITLSVSPSKDYPEYYVFNGNFVDVLIKIAIFKKNTSMKYSFNDVNPKENGQLITNNNFSVRIGEDMTVNEVKKLNIYISNGSEEVIKSYNYQKTESNPLTQKQKDINNLKIYQIMVEAFQNGDDSRNFNTGYGPSDHKGDIKGITNAIPYIKDIGFNAIWLTPIFDSEGTDRLDATGYFTRNYFAVDPHFGSSDDFKELVRVAHENNIYVFLDGVFGHHKGDVKPSPNGKRPQGGNNPVDYNNPETLEFYKEVAVYWIKEYEIDGWRLDQAYQVPVNAWNSIRNEVESVCNERKTSGKTWGILGYMVGEVWKGNNEIKDLCYGNDVEALQSCFDFPLRYSIVQVLASQEDSSASNAKNQPASKINDGFNSHSVYPEYAQSNLMLGNHDLVRFGDLIQRAGFGGKENADYWKRHKAAFSLMAQFTGPITVYYNEEIGFEVEGYINNRDSGYYDDHAARSSGKISNLTTDEEGLKNYLKALLTLRNTYKSLQNGVRKNIIASDYIFADLKEYNNEKVLFILNSSTSVKTAEITSSSISGTKLINLITNEETNLSTDKFILNIEGLSGNFYSVK